MRTFVLYYMILLLCQSWAVELIITCYAIGLWADWDHYGNKFLNFSVYILCLVLYCIAVNDSPSSHLYIWFLCAKYYVIHILLDRIKSNPINRHQFTNKNTDDLLTTHWQAAGVAWRGADDRLATLYSLATVGEAWRFFWTFQKNRQAWRSVDDGWRALTM